MERSKFKALKKELEALIPKNDSLQKDETNYDDNFFLSFLYSKDIYTVEGAMAYSIENNIETQYEFLNHIARNLFK